MTRTISPSEREVLKIALDEFPRIAESMVHMGRFQAHATIQREMASLATMLFASYTEGNMKTCKNISAHVIARLLVLTTILENTDAAETIPEEVRDRMLKENN